MAEASVFTWPLRVYWEDTDAGGIVFYANYLKYFERARTEWLRSLGIGQQKLRDDTGGMFVVTDTQLRYVQPARLDDELIVTAQLSATGRAGLSLTQQAFLKTDAPEGATADLNLLCEASIRIAWVNASSLKPTRIPSDLLDRLESRP